MNLGQIRDEAMACGFDPIMFGAGRMNQFINDGYQYVCAQVSYTGDEATMDFATVPGQAIYSAPTDSSDLRNLREVTKNVELDPVSLRDVDRSSPVSTGRPRYYALDGTNFRLWPTPNDVYQLECRYWLIPAALIADTDVPIIPTMWHWLLWTWAVAQGFRAEDDVQRAGAWDQRFQKGLSDFSARVGFRSDMPTHAKSMWDPEPGLGRYRSSYWR